MSAVKRIALLLGAVLVIAGCGGGDETTTVIQEAPDAETTTDASGASLQEFIDQADAICRRDNRVLVGFEGSEEEYARLWRKSDKDLDALEVPPEVETEWRQYREALDQQLRFILEGNEREQREADERKEAAAREIGFAVCGTG